MKTVARSPLLRIIALCALLVGPLPAGAVSRAAAAPDDVLHHPDRALSERAAAPFAPEGPGNLPAVTINEVMARPPAGAHQWVELKSPGTRRILTLPVILSGGPAPAAAAPAAAAPAAPGEATTGAGPAAASGDISGWQISNQSGGIYTIPEALPPLPDGCFVLIHFDGQGARADDYSFADGVAVLHAAAADIFTPAADQVALYAGASHSAGTIRDFMAYGAAPGEAAAHAIAAGLWQAHWWLDFTIGAGAVDASAPPPADRTLGLLPGHANGSPDDWAVFEPPDQTPGRPNPAPRPAWSTVADGAAMASDGFALGWMLTPGASYRLQIDDDGAFGSPLVDQTLNQPYYVPPSPLPGGLFWWRVRTIVGGEPGAWSIPLRVRVIPVTGFQATGDTARAQPAGPDVVLAMTWLRQRKDNNLLCLDGDNEGNPAAPAPKETWDAVHPDGIYTHGRNSCVRASIAMIASHYGGTISMDRIGYRQFENWGSPLADIGEKNNPLRDLGHDRTTLVCGGDGSHGGVLMAWALGLNVADSLYAGGKPTFAQVRGWIDASRPIMRFQSGHQTVIGGYRTLGDGTQQIRLFDPWSGTTWESYATLNITCYYVPPAAAPAVRSDEPGIWTDADGDGVMDWDEQNRFHTLGAWADSDDDWVGDKQEIREYGFDTAGAYSLRGADFDADGKRKELDADNDADGAVDGCEDVDRDGKYEPAAGETDNFSAAGHRACTPLLDILQPTQSNPLNAGAADAPDKILVQVRTATPPSSPVSYTAADFTVRIGGLEGAVVSAYRALDTHFLVVAPQAAPAADYYDLEVRVAGQSDAETRAVFFLPKLRADQVLVVDRSGSMVDYGKLEAAKNAARAFVDHANVDDMIGVVSFETAAAVNYPLTAITGDPEWNAAKAAVNGLATAGATALGSGAQMGYNELLARGKADHDWSLALLSDGMENVAPYWSDAGVSGVIEPSRAVVHTVALGRDADTTLMNAIAGATGGRAYQAGVDILPLAAGEVEAGPGEGAIPGSGAPAASPYGPNLPGTLPNRLADVYKAIGETNGHQQRIWEQTGEFCEKLAFKVPLEEKLPEVIFTVNWDNEKNPITMNLYDPKGNLVKHSPPDVREIRDRTHHQFRIQRPLEGEWSVDLRTNCTNYLFVVSARSNTTMHLGFGLPPEERRIGSKIPIVAVLADEKPIARADVWALVQGPSIEMRSLLQLFDDGAHEDGKPDDGVYANWFNKTLGAGQYVVKATGSGNNNRGAFFVRHRTAGFTVLPRIGYIWLDDLPTAANYRDLMQGRGYTVELIPMDEVAKTLWGRYSLIVIGPDTGEMDSWGTPAALAALRQYSTPVLGLGEGGYAFFGQLALLIGHPNGAHGNTREAYAMDPAHAVWHSPSAIPLARGRLVQVYQKTQHVTIHMVRPPAGVTLLGREPADEPYYPLIQQTVRYLLWGYQAGPPAMTRAGRDLFINVVRHLAGM
jgi:Mg-chelatase subunit ChlD